MCMLNKVIVKYFLFNGLIHLVKWQLKNQRKHFHWGTQIISCSFNVFFSCWLEWNDYMVLCESNASRHTMVCYMLLYANVSSGPEWDEMIQWKGIVRINRFMLYWARQEAEPRLPSYINKIYQIEIMKPHFWNYIRMRDILFELFMLIRFTESIDHYFWARKQAFHMHINDKYSFNFTEYRINFYDYFKR